MDKWNAFVSHSKLEKEWWVAWVCGDVVRLLVLFVEKLATLATILLEILIVDPFLFLFHGFCSLYLLLGSNIGAHHIDARFVQGGLGQSLEVFVAAVETFLRLQSYRLPWRVILNHDARALRWHLGLVAAVQALVLGVHGG